MNNYYIFHLNLEDKLRIKLYKKIKDSILDRESFQAISKQMLDSIWKMRVEIQTHMRDETKTI